MSFPSPSLPAPALALYQLSYRGLQFGGLARGTPYQLIAFTGGLDLPGVQSGDVARPLDAGEFAGVDTAAGQDVAIDLLITADATGLDHARQQLGGVFSSTGGVEQPLFVSLPSGTFARMCRPRKLAYPVDIGMLNNALGGVRGGKASALLHATDPRWYGSPSKTQTVGLPAASAGGLAVPSAAPWTLAPGSVGGLLDVWNLGTVPMFPVLVFTGPCTNPSATNLSIPGSPKLTFAVSMAPGDTLIVDTDFQSAVYYTAGSDIGSPRENTEVPGSTWWNLLPAGGPADLALGGANVIAFTSSDPGAVAGTLTVQSADAYATL